MSGLVGEVLRGGGETFFYIDDGLACPAAVGVL